MASFSEVHKQTLGQWSPNGRYLAAAAQSRALVRDSGTLTLVQVFVCIDRVERLEWSPDSEYLLTEVARQGVLQVWSVRDAEWQCKVDEGLAGIARARWAPSSRHLLVVSDFQVYLSVWPLEDGAASVQIRHPKYPHKGLAFSRLGSKFMALLRRSDCRDSVSVHSCEERFAQLLDFQVAGDIGDLAWSHDDGSLVLWERPARAARFFWYSLRGELMAQVSDCGSLRAAFPASTGHLIAAAGLDGALHVVSCATRSVLAVLSHNLKAAVAEAGGAEEVVVLQEEFTPDAGWASLADGPRHAEGPSAGTVGYTRVRDVGAVKVMEERPSPEPPLDAEGAPRQGISTVVFSPGERYVATRHEGMPTAVWVWDLGKLVLAALLLHRTAVRSLVWDPSAGVRGSAARLAIATADLALFLWSPGAGCVLPCPLSMARLSWRVDGSALLVQERDRACVCSLGPAAPLAKAAGGA